MDEERLANPSPPPEFDPDVLNETKSEIPVDKADGSSEDEVASVKEESLKYDDAWGACENDYYCNVCKSSMNSAYTYYTHLKGKRHKKKLAAASYVSLNDVKLEIVPNVILRHIKVAGTPIFIKTRQLKNLPLIQNAVNEHKGPIVGLSFVTEIQLLDKSVDPIYHCALCPADCQVTTILNHAIGFKHRMAYMKLVDSERYKVISNSTTKKSTLSEKVEHYAELQEKIDDRGQMLVEVQVDEDDPNYDMMEVSDCEKIHHQLPPSTMPQLIQQVRNSPSTSYIQLLRDLTIDLSKKFEMNDEEQTRGEILRDGAISYYYETMITRLNKDPEKMEKVVSCLVEGNYSAVLGEVFYMTIGPVGEIISPILLQLMKEKKM